MAYVSKEDKAKIVAALKKAFGTDAKKRGFSYTVSVRNLSTINMNIKKGTVNFLGSYKWIGEKDTYLSVSRNYHEEFSGEAGKIIKKALDCLNIDNYDNSDVMTDYFDVGRYISINIGTWDKPYILEEK